MIGANVYLWGTNVGAVTQESPSSPARFNYSREFLSSGIELAPLTMPLQDKVYSFPTLPQETFHLLPGMLADSLPDKFGNKLIEQYLTQQNRTPEDFSAVERLCYVGTRGMGALEYYPATDLGSQSSSIDVDRLVRLASDILEARQDFNANVEDEGMQQLISVGTSAGGARAKAIIAWNEATNEVRSGQIDAGKGFEYWIMKFDGVSNNKDKEEKADGPAYTRIEYAYYLMAKAAGIEINPSRLYEESERYHFMTKRFDRLPDGGKLHMQTLGGMAHYDFNAPGMQGYEQVADILYRLNLGQNSVEELYRRMVFNVLGRNHDDHVKNISFLMDRNGQWSLSPAYDITFAYSPKSFWLKQHQMSIHGKLEDITLEDLLQVASRFNMKTPKALRILEDVDRALAKWEAFAKEANLPEAPYEKVSSQLLSLEKIS